MLGLAVMLAGGKWTRPAMILGLVVAAALIPVTIARQRAWHNRISLWSDTLRVNPLSQTAANNLGFARYDAGDLPGAIEAWRRALELTRDQEPDSWAGIAIASEALAKNDEADAAFRRAVALDVRYADPDALLRALIWERHQADALRPIAARNAHRLTRLPS
jgi:tetratricopeptide (TPR) repeat protein